ncbi:hypothetical protein KIV45_20950 [Janthinobacterium lividum]|nr:hypothetical protein KIV45_20950 [Janthinobacterium lividum]
MLRFQPYSPAAVLWRDARDTGRGQQGGAAPARLVAQPQVEGAARQMPAVAIWIAEEVVFRPGAIPPGAVAVVGRMALLQEGVKQVHVLQQACGCRRQRFADACQRCGQPVDQQDPVAPRQVPGPPWRRPDRRRR